MKTQADWIKGAVRAVSALLAVFFFVGLGFRGGSPLGGMSGLLVVAGAAAVAFAPSRMFQQKEGRVLWMVIVLLGMIGGVICIWDALVTSEVPDTRFAFISAVGVLCIALGITRLLPDSR